MVPATMLAIIDLTAGEVMIILVFALIVLGPERLPEIARSMGRWAAKARKLLGTLQAEMREVLDDPAMQPLKDVGEFVAQPRKKLTELALAAEAEATAEAEAEAAGQSGDGPEPEGPPAVDGAPSFKKPIEGPSPRELAEAAREASADGLGHSGSAVDGTSPVREVPGPEVAGLAISDDATPRTTP